MIDLFILKEYSTPLTCLTPEIEDNGCVHLHETGIIDATTTHHAREDDVLHLRGTEHSPAPRSPMVEEDAPSYFCESGILEAQQ